MNQDPDIKGVAHNLPVAPMPQSPIPPAEVLPPPETIIHPSLSSVPTASFPPSNAPVQSPSTTMYPTQEPNVVVPQVTTSMPSYMQTEPSAFNPSRSLFVSPRVSGQNISVVITSVVIGLNLIFLLLAFFYEVGKFLSENPRNDGVSFKGLIILSIISFVIVAFASYKGMIYSNISSSKRWDLAFKIMAGVGLVLFIAVLITPILNK